jgi:hypothetical protein
VALNLSLKHKSSMTLQDAMLTKQDCRLQMGETVRASTATGIPISEAPS